MSHEPKTTALTDIPSGLPEGVTIEDTPELPISNHESKMPVMFLLNPMGDLAQDVREVLLKHGSSDDYIELPGK